MGSAIIEVGLGLVMVFFVLSVIVTQINNLIVNFLNLRAENLRAWFHKAITDDGVRNEILTHPMINMVEAQLSPHRPNRLRRLLNRLGRWAVGRLVPGAEKYQSTTKVSYIAPNVFADVLLGVFVKDDAGLTAQSDTEKVYSLIISMKNRVEDTPLEQTLETVIATAQSFQDAQVKVAAWFDNSMNHLSTMFKRRVQLISFVAGLLVAIILNVDTLHLARTLWNDPALRQAVIFAAESASQNQLQASTEGATTPEEVEKLRQTLQSFLDLRLPIGWEVNTAPDALALVSPRNAANFSPLLNPADWLGFLVLKVLGWVLTTFAIMQGSDFWFNLLGRIASARAAVTKISETGSSTNPGTGVG